MTAADNALTAVADRLDKAKGEIDALIAELQAADVSPAIVARLQALGQSFDDIVPDVTPPAPTPESTPEPTSEPTPEPTPEPGV